MTIKISKFLQFFFQGGSSLPEPPKSSDPGENEEEERGFDWFQDEMEEEEPSCSHWPMSKVSKEERKEWCKPWKSALILGLLGWNISLKMLDQRLKNLWKLEYGFQLIDVDGGVFIARLYSWDDYLRVLEEGHWIVLGHYLKSKWKPNIRSSLEEISSTLVLVRLPKLLIELFNEDLPFEYEIILGELFVLTGQPWHRWGANLPEFVFRLIWRSLWCKWFIYWVIIK